MRYLLLIVLLLPSLVWAQEQAEKDPFEPIKYFVGEWEGHETGAAGVGKGTRAYEFVIKDKFLHFKNRSEFPPQEKNPEGEVHEDWGFFSYDQGRQVLVLRQFHGEGYVNQYTLDSVSADGKIISFTTEAIENVPEGFRARYIFTIEGEDVFSEKFQLASPGKDFSPLIENRWTRKK